MPEVVRRRFLRKKEVKLFLQDVSRNLGIHTEHVFGPKPQIEVLETAKHQVFSVDGLSVLARSGETLFPTLTFRDFLLSLPEVIVDMGAVSHVCNGADVMAPGVKEIKRDFDEKALVTIVDERNRKLIAVGQALFDSTKARSLGKGKLFKTLHYVGDDVWKAIQEA